MSNYLVTDTELTSVADAIQGVTGGSSGMAFPSGFAAALNNYEPYLNEITDLTATFYLQVPNSETLTIKTNSDTTLSLIASTSVPYPKMTIFYEIENIKFNGTEKDKTLFDFTFARWSGTGTPQIKVRAKNSNVSVPNGDNGYKKITVSAKAHYANVT